MAKKINIGMLGYGNVGSGTCEIFKMNREKIIESTGYEPVVKKVLVRNITPERAEVLGADVLTTSPHDVTFNPDIDIVVEVLGGIEPATTYMLDALNHGKHVVTANKAALAANYEKLTAAAEANHVKLLFEASVAGALPVLTSIRSALSANVFSEVSGIVNGTTNFILTKMAKEGLSYEQALSDAQRLGFAEADPTADVEGIDAANKLTILMMLMFGIYVAPGDIPRTGITGVTKEDLAAAEKAGEVIKLIAHAELGSDSKLTCSVKPQRISKDHPLAGVSNEFNAVYVTGNAAGELMFYGRGAGPLPTGSAVAGDVLEIMRSI